MSRSFDKRTTTFTSEGQLYQVENAMEAVKLAGAAIGILADDGIILVCEKKVASPLLDNPISDGKFISNSEKLFKIDNHIICAVAGITSDANTLVKSGRLAAQRYLKTYGKPIPVEQLVRKICDIEQGYTQFGGLRPFGVSVLFAGWDIQNGFQLYLADPSGNYSGWKAVAIGSNHNSATTMLRQELLKKDKSDGESKKEEEEIFMGKDLNLDEASKILIRTVAKTLDSTILSSKKLEFAFVTTPKKGVPMVKILNYKEIDDLLEKYKEFIEIDNNSED